MRRFVMNNLFLISVALFTTFLHSSASDESLSGPFMLFGLEGINALKGPALQGFAKRFTDKFYSKYFLDIAHETLRTLFVKSAATLIFVKDFESKLTKQNFPELSKIVNNGEAIYLPQKTLPLDPIGFNLNTEAGFVTKYDFF